MQLRSRLAAFWLSSILIAASPASAEGLPEELREGLAAYALETGDPFLALNFTDQKDERTLAFLRGEAFADLGLRQNAAESFQAVVAANGPLAAKAKLKLAQLAFESANLVEAETLLKEAAHRLSGDELAQALFYRAEILLAKDRLPEAAKALSKMPDSHWASMGYFNLASAYANRESSPARPVVALRVAASMVSEADEGLDAELADRSRIAAGLLSLRAQEPEKALSFLNKVHLDSYNASEGFYLHGLALAGLDRYRTALQSWHRAIKYPMAFAGVPEAHIAMGRAYDEEGFSGQAAEAYLSANAAFDKEIVNLRTLIDDVEKKGGYAAMIEASRHSDVEWFLAESRSVTAPRLAWLMRYMESPEAQSRVRAVAEIDELIERLSESRHDLDVFESMLRGRISRVSGNSGLRTRERLQDKRRSLEQRAETLLARYESAVEKGDVTALASGQLADRLSTVERLEAKGEDQRTPEEQEKLRRLKGLMTWEAQRQFERNQAGLDRQLKRLQDDLREVEQHLGSFDRKAAQAPKRFRALLQRVESGHARIDTLIDRAQRYRVEASDKLTAHVLGYLQQQVQAMNDYVDRSRQEIAHLYEFMAISRLEKEERQKEASAPEGEQ